MGWFYGMSTLLRLFQVEVSLTINVSNYITKTDLHNHFQVVDTLWLHEPIYWVHNHLKHGLQIFNS